MSIASECRYSSVCDYMCFPFFNSEFYCFLSRSEFAEVIERWNTLQRQKRMKKLEEWKNNGWKWEENQTRKYPSWITEEIDAKDNHTTFGV